MAERSALRRVGPGAGGARLALALLHGFGANAFSWSYVDRQLAARLHAQVTAHDMPGFGLTQRCALQGRASSPSCEDEPPCIHRPVPVKACSLYRQHCSVHTMLSPCCGRYCLCLCAFEQQSNSLLQHLREVARNSSMGFVSPSLRQTPGCGAMAEHV